MDLEAELLTSGYGNIPIVHEASLRITDQGVVAILGPNGAGKSTLLKTLARQLPVMHGELRLGGRRYDNRDATWAAREGIALVGQSANVFPDLTVRENLSLGALHHPSSRSAIDDFMSRFPILGDRAQQRAESLSGGERQLLAVACALLMRPAILLLDEPTTGLAPIAALETVAVIDEVVREGVGVAWVVEQMPETALKRASSAYFVEGGQVTEIGDPATLLEAGRLERMMLHE